MNSKEILLIDRKPLLVNVADADIGLIISCRGSGRTGA